MLMNKIVEVYTRGRCGEGRLQRRDGALSGFED